MHLHMSLRSDDIQGWFIVVGLGGLFALFTAGLVYIGDKCVLLPSHTVVFSWLSLPFSGTLATPPPLRSTALPGAASRSASPLATLCRRRAREIRLFFSRTDAISGVLQWTWAATLLQSSNVAYSYGVSGPFWYASGATIQVLLFAILAVEIKRKCPALHTVLEIVHARWGTAAHSAWICKIIKPFTFTPPLSLQLCSCASASPPTSS